jgi:hypothetical protein
MTEKSNGDVDLLTTDMKMQCRTDFVRVFPNLMTIEQW